MNERAEFEEAMSSPRGEYMPTAFKVETIDGPYLNDFVQAAWEGWQLRAALASSPSQPAWISVKDRLPAGRMFVLRFAPDAGPLRIRVEPYDPQYGLGPACTHWMQLPAAPALVEGKK